MILRKFVFVAALAWTAAALADVQPAVQPGGDIPKAFQAPVPAVPKSGDIPQRFNAPRGEFHSLPREAMIPLRDWS
jgi:hypothetical protein